MTRANIAARNEVDLLAEILTKAPSLPKALCRDQSALFDCVNGSTENIRRAIAICRRCDELPACREWASTQRGLVGVVAGQYRWQRGRRCDDE
jgi:hypothetical protein